MKIPHVIIVLGRCAVSTDRTFGLRLEERRRHDWFVTWAFSLPPAVAGREGYDRAEVSGSFALDEQEYPECPGCGQRGLSLCGSCDKVSCWNPAQSTVRCPWCGLEGTVEGQISSLRAGGDI